MDGLGSMSDLVIQASGRTDFEDGSRIGNQSKIKINLQRVCSIPLINACIDRSQGWHAPGFFESGTTPIPLNLIMSPYFRAREKQQQGSKGISNTFRLYTTASVGSLNILIGG